MNIIKLNAIGSTNDYLKELSSKNDLENGTIVVAKDQISGRGQMGTKWASDSGNSLTFSTLFKFDDFNINRQFYISMAVSLAIHKVLQQMSDKRFYIKWPNDIMAGNKKIGGILIENIVKGGNIKNSVIGIGLNINQANFDLELPNAISLKMLDGVVHDLDAVLLKIVKSLEIYYKFLVNKEFEQIKSGYLNVLYKYKTPVMFKSIENGIFLGKIIGIAAMGKVQVELENEQIQEFGLKEIELIN